MRPVRRSTAGVIAVLGFCLVLPAFAHATYPGLNGKIAFARGGDIWTMGPDGSSQSALISNGHGPAWSADGSQLAYACGVPGPNAICAANADGSSQRAVGSYDSATFSNLSPTWSPDSQRILWEAIPYCHPCVQSTENLWRMNSDGSDPIFFRQGSGPDWSPDGKQIAYVANDFSGTAQVFVMPANNSSPTQRTSGSTANFDPRWSPDNKIAFVSNRDGNAEIYTMNADGTNQTRVTNDPGQDTSPEWSPDGQKIAFVSNRGGNSNIYVMNADGSNVQQLTNDPAGERAPDWQPIRTEPPHPKGATPMRASLVPAFDQCTAPNTQHGQPLAFGSCKPPSQSGASATIGQQSIGSVLLRVVPGNPPTTANEDVKIDISITDVRRLSDQGAYTGELDFPLSVRITDNYNGGAGVTPATVQEQDYFHNPMHVRIPCAPTGNPNIGSTCSVQTSIKAAFQFAPGGARAIWELGQIAVYDGGPDGAVTSFDDNTPLAVQGVFAP